MKWPLTRSHWPWGLLAGMPALAWLLPTAFGQAPSFRDQGDFFYPLKLYTAARLRHGDIPLWNPLSGLGEPWLANLQSGVFYPPTALFFLPSAALAGGLFLLCHFWLGAWGTWRFLKEETVSDAGALVGAGFYASSGFAASISTFWNHFSAWSYLPAIAWLARSGLRNRSSRLALALFIGLQAMAGSPEISAGSLVIAAALVLTREPSEQSGWSEPPGASRLASLAAASILGLAIAGWALVPFGELLAHSDRRSALPRAVREAGTVEMSAFASTLGISSGMSGSSYLGSLYLGPIGLIAAGAAFAEKERRRLVVALAVVGGAALLFSLATPPGAWVRSLPPLDRIRYPAKALTATTFALAVLAGLGTDALRFRQAGQRRIPLLAWGALLLALTLAAPLSPETKLLSSVGAAALLTLVIGRFQRGRGALAALAALLLIASLFLANRGMLRFAPEGELRRVPESAAFLARVPGRVLTPPMPDLAIWVLKEAAFDAGTLRRQREALLGYTNLLTGVRTVRTAAALSTQAAARIADAIDAAPDVEPASGTVSARLLWTPFQPLRLGSRKVGDFFRAPLNAYRPRLSVVFRHIVEPDPAKAWRQVVDGKTDWRTTAVLDRVPDAAPPAKPGSIAMVSILEDLPERLAARTTTDANGILVVTDLAYPGWKVELDGRPAPLLRSDGYLRAVALPAGEHRVVFQYRPLSVYAGAGVTFLALAVFLILAWSGEPSTKALL
ncbi:MAG TPA: hypothetical protein VKJ00_05210 [Thermoanaerobaculia bacterium]|nr:hypothetical protein [Thermoanaerobaculia bacterium]